MDNFLYNKRQKPLINIGCLFFIIFINKLKESIDISEKFLSSIFLNFFMLLSCGKLIWLFDIFSYFSVVLLCCLKNKQHNLYNFFILFPCYRYRKWCMRTYYQRICACIFFYYIKPCIYCLFFICIKAYRSFWVFYLHIIYMK